MKKTFLVVISIMLIFILAYPQETGNVAGYVTDSDEEPLTGVNITLEGTSYGSPTDEEGYFMITDIPVGDYTLKATFIGYKQVLREISIRADETIQTNITMEQTEIRGEEVVAYGYRVKERGEVTGSVTNIGGDELEATTQMDLTKSLQGKMPGVVISDRGGEPGSGQSSIFIRGKSTLGNNQPLIVIDGVPRESFSHISPNDVESINILKDASAAIYGARAANGVIVITTKQGERAGKDRIRFTSNYTLSSFTRVPEMMSSYQHSKYMNEADERAGNAKTWTQEDLEKFKSGSSPLTHPNTDMYKSVFKDYAPEQHYNLSLLGGNERLRYYLSGDLLMQNGMYEADDMDYNQYQIRANIDAKVTENLNIGTNLSGRVEKTHRPSYGEEDLFELVQRSQPYRVDWYPNGLPGYGGENGQNPVMISGDEAGWEETTNKILHSKFSFRYDLGWLTKGLDINGYSAFDFEIPNWKHFNNVWEVYNYNPSTEEYEENPGYSGVNSRTLAQSNEVTTEQLHHIQLNYERTFGKHTFDGFAAYEQQEGDWQNLYAYRRDLVSEELVQLFTGGTDQRDNSGSADEWGRVNYFGSVGYDFAKKYMIDFTLRHDGSSNFAEGEKFGTFPGVSAGWNISEESFMYGFRDWLTNLKLRASWAKMGNDRIPNFQYLNKYDLSGYYIFGEDPVRVNTFVNTNTANPNITWEESYITNVGFDLNLWDGLLTMNLDYFDEKRRQILITRSESVPDYTALELPEENLGKVDNRGIELQLGHNNTIGEITYSVGGNFTYNHNEIVYMDEPQDVPDYREKEGHPMDSWVVYKTDGIYETQEEIDNSVHHQGAQPGDIKIIDMNGDGKIDGDDMYRKYTSPIPEIQFGFNVGIEYKGLQVNALFQGQAKAETMILFTDLGNRPEYLFTNRWTEDNRNADYPAPYRRGTTYNAQPSDFWLYDASFLRLKNLEIAYNLPEKLVGFNGLRVYLRGTNLWTLSEIDHFDPEINSTMGRYYPQLKRITSGLSITF
ncbi:MAG: TonB-dependent receptor [Candidatus Marinimicrobia bacterium]|nr:TonB-dependent receptor [Candidatus Neomarinimicrobiota bacterium]